MVRFVRPTFKTGELEFQCDGEEVSIHGTPIGLARLAELCMKLAQIPETKDTEHYHLEDYELLTSESLRGALAVFHNGSKES